MKPVLFILRSCSKMAMKIISDLLARWHCISLHPKFRLWNPLISLKWKLFFWFLISKTHCICFWTHMHPCWHAWYKQIWDSLVKTLLMKRLFFHRVVVCFSKWFTHLVKMLLNEAQVCWGIWVVAFILVTHCLIVFSFKIIQNAGCFKILFFHSICWLYVSMLIKDIMFYTITKIISLSTTVGHTVVKSTLWWERKVKLSKAVLQCYTTHCLYREYVNH